MRVAGTGEAALAKAGITGKSPTPAARSQASAGAPDLDTTVAMLVRGGIAMPGGVLGRG